MSRDPAEFLILYKVLKIFAFRLLRELTTVILDLTSVIWTKEQTEQGLRTRIKIKN